MLISFFFLLLLPFQHFVRAEENPEINFALEEASRLLESKMGASINCSNSYQDLKVISGDKVSISILTQDQANEAFKVLKDQEDIPFSYKRDGCFVRAHKMVKILDTLGIESGKFFAEGKLIPKGVFKKKEEHWSYHVAPFVFVEEKGVPKVYVLDPALSDSPMKVADWMRAMTTTPESSVLRTYATQKQNVLPKHKYRKQSHYSKEDDDYMERKLRTFRKEAK